MRAEKSFVRFVFLMLAVALIGATSIDAQKVVDSNSVYIPNVAATFDGPEFTLQRTVYRSVVTIDELPAIHIFDATAKPLRPMAEFDSSKEPNEEIVGNQFPENVVSQNRLDRSTNESSSQQSKIAQTGFEEDQPLKPVGLSWVGDPVFAFGSGLFPMSDQAIDKWKLTRLKKSIDEVSERIKQWPDLPEETNEAITLAMTRAEEWHSLGSESVKRIDTMRNEIASLPERMVQLEKAMTQPLAKPPIELDPKFALESHEAMLQEQLAAEKRLQDEFNAAQLRVTQQSDQIRELAKREQELKDNLATATANVENHAGAEGGAELSEQVTLVENQAAVVALKIQLRRFTVENQWLVATEKSTLLKRDWLKRQWDHAQSTTKLLAGQVSKLRDEMIKADAANARAEAMAADPILKELAEQNATLAEQREEISRINRANDDEQILIDSQLNAVQESRQKLDEHLKAAGHSLTVGHLLRLERTELPQNSRSLRRIAEIEAALPDLKLNQLRINEELSTGVPKQEKEIEKSLEQLDPNQSVVPAAELKLRANDLITKKRDFLYKLNTEYKTYLNGLAKLQIAHKQLLKQTKELRTYIDQHVLWIRSAEPLDSSHFRKSVAAIKSIGTSDQWQAMVKFLSTRLNGRWLLISILLIVLLIGVGMRKQLDRRLRYVCSRRSEFRVGPLLRSLFLTAFQASLLPALTGTLGWLLASAYETGTLKDSISRGLMMITPQLFVASFVYRLAIREGLAETQLGWSRQVCDLIRGASGTIARYCLPLIAITHALEIYESGKWTDSLGRLTFIASMIVLTAASFRLLRGVGNAWKTDPNSSRSIWEQTFALWSPLIVLGPVALACVSALGYMYSSVFLGIRLLMTWWLILGVVSLYYLVSRLIDIGYNIIVARRRWRTSPESRKHGLESGNLTTDNEIDGIRRQVMRLLHVTSVAVCLVVAFSYWHDAIPAVKAFDYGLWQVNQQVAQLDPMSEDVNEMKYSLQLSWITVGDIFRFMMVMAATFVLSRNLPGLLQMVILDRLPLDRGGKYAISIVCRYLVAAIGLVLACRMIGFTWSSVQWLVAAMSVGLGFGLQEIFANFVAGIIILLERPIRVGDYVTVNGTSGFVTRIQLRATMIIDFDRRELIVPNKKFITDDVMNWTLSDAITRVVVKVGIAYGSDTRLAQSILLRVARDNSIVLRDPKPEVIFSKFGDSSLDFELRVHIPNRDGYADILHQLHMSIDQEFREKGIEIAFPQSDIHVKGMDSLIRSANKSQHKKAG